ncbi:tannase and feruloyl esterase-domain-containing protein [Mycena rosella]|uniref:Carboxylic ester hydrolase n=1 Tax=Mycena rosella TaxID=1033263 RepID=A0AAD7DQN0_MYCRO|nr:tannase and feruloyl esterase-domain-containing protein [Mycena rosella]
MHAAWVCERADGKFSTATSATSSVRGDPDEWYGRFLGVGNGALGGCRHIMQRFHFATVGSSNGHDGNTGPAFLGNEEVLNEFAFRSIHVEAVIGKRIVAQYYGRPHVKSYYIGCSTGGRQGTQTALKYPENFDVIMAGAPATDWNHLVHWGGTLSCYVGAPDPDSSPAFIAPDLWNVRRSWTSAIGLTVPDACEFRPETLMCSGDEKDQCLIRPQTAALHKIYSPLYLDGKLIYPRFYPGAEGISSALFSRQLSAYTAVHIYWLKYAVLARSELDFNEYGPQYKRLMDEVNPGGIPTTCPRSTTPTTAALIRHVKLIILIASGNSKRVYDLVAGTLGPASIDALYRLFLVPRMGHCEDGPGAARFGQLGGQSAVNARTNNVLLALVDWVEGGVALDTIIGTATDGATRLHCRYPQRIVWDDSGLGCEA